jgi:hypothetical protein
MLLAFNVAMEFAVSTAKRCESDHPRGMLFGHTHGIASSECPSDSVRINNNRRNCNILFGAFDGVCTSVAGFMVSGSVHVSGVGSNNIEDCNILS